jgi:TetR/AcrR family transcriptional regulator, lmrAB and yxaGH operons repressor
MAPVAKHRERLVTAAMTLFRMQGYAATGLAEILSESGAPKGSLYHYFPDGKEAIGEAALHQAAERTGKALIRLIADANNIPEMLRAYGTRAAATMQESGFSAGCPVATIALEAAPQSVRLTEASRGALDLWCRLLGEALARAGVAQTRATALGDFIVSSFEGALILARVRQDTAPILTAAEELAGLVTNELHTQRSVS